MPDLTPSAAALLAVLRGRRSVRRFRADPVPEEWVTTLAEAASWAPSAANRQAWRLAAVTSSARITAMAAAVRAEMARLRDQVRSGRADADAYLANLIHFERAPLVFAPFHRTGLTLREAVASGRTPAPPIEAEALASVAAAIQNLLLCAHALGLGACWMTGPLVAAAALAPILEIPRGWALSALVPVGFPAEAPAPPPRRRLDALLRRL